MRTSKWVCLLVGALSGAAICPSVFWLVIATDETKPEFELVYGIWLIVAMPGVVLQNQGHLTLAFLMAFYGVSGTGIASIGYYAYECLLSMLSMRNEEPFAHRGDARRDD